VDFRAAFGDGNGDVEEALVALVRDRFFEAFWILQTPGETIFGKVAEKALGGVRFEEVGGGAEIDGGGGDKRAKRELLEGGDSGVFEVEADHVMFHEKREHLAL
jgi:hypothetical protein